MGMFDEFESADGRISVQLKVGHNLMNRYREGDALDPKEFPDAFYYGLEGVVVIREGRVESVSREAPDNSDPARKLLTFTKWGPPFNPEGEEHLGDLNPLAKAVKYMEDGLAK
jgi:hypothetical protein